MIKATYCVGVNEIGINSYVEHDIPEIELDESSVAEPNVNIDESYGELEQ